MDFLIRSFLAILACTTLVSASIDVTSWNSTACTNSTKTQRKAWHKMSNTEKTSYIDAELCLINTPATLGFEGAQTKFDELQYAHIWQSNVIHYSVSPLSKSHSIVYESKADPKQGTISPLTQLVHVRARIPTQIPLQLHGRPTLLGRSTRHHQLLSPNGQLPRLRHCLRLRR